MEKSKKRKNLDEKYFWRLIACCSSLKQPNGIRESVQAVLGPATNALPIIATGFPSEADDSSAVTTIEDLLYQNKPTNQASAVVSPSKPAASVSKSNFVSIKEFKELEQSRSSGLSTGQQNPMDDINTPTYLRNRGNHINLGKK